MDDLRHRQEALLRALVTAESAPDGFDPARLHIAAQVLLNKRCAAVAARLPLVRAKLGSATFTELFFAWAGGTPKRASAEEAADFFAHLEHAGYLPRRSRWHRAFRS